jgi:hypothetical protein
MYYRKIFFKEMGEILSNMGKEEQLLNVKHFSQLSPHHFSGTKEIGKNISL